VALYPQHADDPGQTWSSGYSTPSKAKQLPALLTEKKNGSRNEQSANIKLILEAEGLDMMPTMKSKNISDEKSNVLSTGKKNAWWHNLQSVVTAIAISSVRVRHSSR
jgi:hypothetical protein